jgi:hypothetical protein
MWDNMGLHGITEVLSNCTIGVWGVEEARCIPAINYMGLCGRSKESRTTNC